MLNMEIALQLQAGLAETERVRLQALAIQVADERSHHRVRDQAMAHMTAATGNLIQHLAAIPKSIPQILTPQLFTTNITNVSPTTFVTNLQTNIQQTTHNMHNHYLNFINNTSNRILNMGESPSASPSDDIPQLSIVGGPPQPPPPPSGIRLAIRDGPALTPEPVEPDPIPAILDRPPKVIKKPKLKVKIPIPAQKKPIFIVDPPPRRRARKDPELQDLLDSFDREPKRARLGSRPRIRTVAAV